MARVPALPPDSWFMRYRTLLAGLLLVMLTVLCHGPALGAFYIWDDDEWLVRNEVVKAPNGLAQIWTDYRATPDPYPLVFTSFWAEYRIWKFWPVGFHAVNIAWHAGAAVLLWLLLRRLGLAGAWVIAAIWALHPVQVETVAWVAERKNVMSACFLFASLLMYVRFAGLGQTTAGSRGADLAAPAGRRNWQVYGWALLFFICSLLSKSATAPMPVVILLLLWWKRGRVGWRDVALLVPFLLAGLGAGLAKALLEPNHVGAIGPAFEFTALQRILIAGRAASFYVGKLLFPHPLTLIYPKWTIDVSAWWQYLYPVGVVAALLALWLLRRKIGRGPVVAAGCFLVMVAPALGFISFYTMLYTFVADHYQYVACAAVIAGIVEPLVRLGQRLIPRLGEGAVLRIGALAGAVVILNLGVLTWGYASLYQWPEALWRYTIEQNDDAWPAMNNLARQLTLPPTPDSAPTRESLEAARKIYETVIARHPDQPTAYGNLALVFDALGDKDSGDRMRAKAREVTAARDKMQREHGAVGPVGFP